ncbi:MAG: GDSL-type esterase/lipase family protein, partial [Saprospiraceae bacterium]
YLQRTQGGQKINIVHIGDSHILGSFFTDAIRARLQKAFGDAGRGLIFPYKLAGSNGPRDYLVECNSGRWSGASCQKDLSAQTNFGLSGFTLETNNPAAALTFRLRDTTTSETHLFTKVTVFQKRSALQYDLNVRDEVSNQQAQLLIDGDYSRSFYFDRPVGQVTISVDKATSQQKLLTLDGVALENELSGVIYNSIGVNGAKYMDFARAKYFGQQVADLSPDLIILSMGTNEAQGHTDPAYLYRSIELMVNALQQNSPQAFILLTTPADSYLRGKGFNPNLADVSAVISQFAREKGLALWDLYQFSGGQNSALNWKSQGLMSSDSVHYSRAGYLVQGKLLYQSLVKAYNDYTLNRP